MKRHKHYNQPPPSTLINSSIGRLPTRPLQQLHAVCDVMPTSLAALINSTPVGTINRRSSLFVSASSNNLCPTRPLQQLHVASNCCAIFVSAICITSFPHWCYLPDLPKAALIWAGCVFLEYTFPLQVLGDMNIRPCTSEDTGILYSMNRPKVCVL